MSRSGYTDDDCDGSIWLFRNAVERAINGKRGQAFLKEMLIAMDELPEKVLISGFIQYNSGDVCAIGAVCKKRKLNTLEIDDSDPESVANAVGIARVMAQEIAYMNDEFGSYAETPQQRFERMRKWILSEIKT